MGLMRSIFQGTSPAVGEVWSVGMSWRSPLEDVGFDVLQAWATEIASDVVAMVANPIVTLLSSGGAITSVRCEERSEVDDTLVQAAEASLATAKAGSGTPTKVLQCSVCFSLITARPGRSYRGRAYWPAWSYTSTAEMLFGSTNQSNWVGGWRTLVNLVQVAGATTTPSLDLTLVVRSRLLHVSTDVESYACGSVPDTQRRRRDAIPETYAVLAV